MPITTLAVANFIGAGLAGAAWGAVEKATIAPVMLGRLHTQYKSFYLQRISAN